MIASPMSVGGHTVSASVPIPTELRYFWQPGCSSCVKVKELLTELGIAFTSVNILEQAGALQELLARGMRSVPVLIRGEEVICAQSLEDVAQFVGHDWGDDRLPPEELMRRWLYFLDVAKGLIRQIPPDRLQIRPVPRRPRTVCSLSYHIYQVVEGFLGVMCDGLLDSRDFDSAVYAHLRTVDDLLGYAGETVPRLKRYWQGLEDKSGQRIVATYYGLQSTHQLLDRATWHSAHHTRQLSSVLEGFGVVVQRPIDAGAYAGLPMPEAIWT